MKKLSIADLPLYSPWPARLLGLSRFSRGDRTQEDLLREYDTDKYGSCIDYLKKHPNSSIGDVRWFELGGTQQSDICISIDQELYLSSIASAYELREKTFLDNMKNSMRECDTVVELGSGYGHNLKLLQSKYKSHMYIGGEFSTNAITLGKRLLSSDDIKMHSFNFYDENYDVFDALSSNKILVLTYHSSEMLPDAELLLKRLEPYNKRIVSVIQLEPIYEMSNPDTLLGLLRQSYIQMNHYNTNLLTALNANNNINITRTHYDVFGVNPLFPESLVEWHFK